MDEERYADQAQVSCLVTRSLFLLLSSAAQIDGAALLMLLFAIFLYFEFLG